MIIKRLLAAILDFMLIAFLLNVLTNIFVYFRLLYWDYTVNMAIGILINIIFLVRDVFGKDSFLFKRLFKLKIINYSGKESVSFFQKIVRNITYIIWPLELVLLLFKKRKLGDIIAKTDVKLLSTNNYTSNKSMKDVLDS